MPDGTLRCFGAGSTKPQFFRRKCFSLRSNDLSLVDLPGLMENMTDIGPGWYILRDGDSWCAVGGVFVAARPTGWGLTPQEAYTELKRKYRVEGMNIELPPLDDFLVRLRVARSASSGSLQSR
jgi:hypothetical protein